MSILLIVLLCGAFPVVPATAVAVASVPVVTVVTVAPIVLPVIVP